MRFLLALLIISCFILGGCDDDKKVPPPTQDKSVATTQNSNQKQETSTTNKERPLDKSIPVSKEEMDTLIPTARALRLNAEQVKELVQALKQCGVNISDLRDKQKVVYKDSIRGGDGPENIEGVALGIPDFPHFKIIRWYVSYGKGGLSFYIKDLVTKNADTLYWDGAVWADLKSYAAPSDEAVDKIYQYIKKDNKYGETVKIAAFGLKTGTKEDIKEELGFQINDRSPKIIISVMVSRIVKSEVYGGDDKKLFVSYKFTRDGDFIESSTSTDTMESGMLNDLERMKKMSK